MPNYIGVFLLSLIAMPAFAHCRLNLSVGEGKVSGIPTSHVDDFLNTKYTRVDTKVDGTSIVNEIGIECAIGNDFALSVSRLDGLHASVEREVSFSGFQWHGYSIPAIKLFNIHEEANAEAVRASVLKYFDLGRIDPFVRIGAEWITAEHHASIPITDDISIAYDKTYRKTFPYVGAGFVLFRDSPIAVRLEYQLESIPPHKVQTVMLGIVARFRF